MLLHSITRPDPSGLANPCPRQPDCQQGSNRYPGKSDEREAEFQPAAFQLKQQRHRRKNSAEETHDDRAARSQLRFLKNVTIITA